MHTISAEELLRVYNGKYKYVTMDKDGSIALWKCKPSYDNGVWVPCSVRLYLDKMIITEFQDTPAKECIYKAKPSEEDWVGCLCWFADEESRLGSTAYGAMKPLKRIAAPSVPCKYISIEDVGWKYCRPVRPDEIKFFNDDTAEN